MCKVTIFIPVYLVISLFCPKIQAQNGELRCLKSLNQIESTHGFSEFVSNTTVALGAAVPLSMGTLAIIQQDDDLLKKSIYVGTSLAIDFAATYALKYAVNRPRPYITYPYEIHAVAFESSASFPSGHTSFAFATATSLSIAYPKWYVIVPTYAWACPVGYSRMNLGVHYPTDVLAGAALGAGSAWLSWKINQWYWKKRENKKLIGLQAYL